MLKKELDWSDLLLNISQFAQSQIAKDLILNYAPLKNTVAAEQKAEEIIFAEEILNEGAIPNLQCLDSVPSIFERLRIKATLDVKDFMSVRVFLNSATVLKNYFKSKRNSWADMQNSKIGDFKSALYSIDKVISPDGDINEDASSHLKSLFEEKKKLTREVAQLLDRVLSKRQTEVILQDRYVTTREGRLVLPIKSGNQHDIKGLIHDRSFSKQTVFIEPEEAVPVNNRLRDLHLLIQEEIEKILRELSLLLSRQLTALENAFGALLESDQNFSCAKFNKIIKGHAVSFSKNNSMNLKNLRHPLLLAKGIEVVPNTVELNLNKRVLLLSGPNAGGKTVLLKSIGLACQMARCGLPVPADPGSQIPFLQNIDAIVGDQQNVNQDLSSFSSHILRLNQTLNLSGMTALVLVDEICGATDPEEGSALARSFIDNYINKNIFAVVTSHLNALKESWPKDSGLIHGSLEFDTKNNRPTYQLLLGISGQSLALNVAKRLGTPDYIIEKAEDFMSPVARDKSKSLKEIDDLRGQIVELKNKTQSDQLEANHLKTQYQELIKKFREQRDRWLTKALEKAEKKIENLIEDARQERLKNKTLQDIKSELPTIIKSTSSIQKAQTIEDFKTVFKSGTTAFCSRLGRQVIIQSEPNQQGQVYVLADSMRVLVPWHTLSSQSEEKILHPTVRRSGASQSKNFNSDSAPELDLRGCRIDEALDVITKWLDDKIQEGHDRVKIIHGFGTEQLKKSVRQYLSKSHYVSKWEPGTAETGGDGITWVSF